MNINYFPITILILLAFVRRLELFILIKNIRQPLNDLCLRKFIFPSAQAD